LVPESKRASRKLDVASSPEPGTELAPSRGPDELASKPPLAPPG
jgi:hypothetical protein